VSCPGCTLTLRKEPPVPIAQEAGWASRAYLDAEARGKILLPLLRIVQSVVTHYTD